MDYPDSDDLKDGKFTDGDPVAGIPASIASADHMNAVYDEIRAVITAGGLTPDVDNLTQLATSISNQIRSKRLFDVSGTADAIILTTPAGRQPVTSLNDCDEFTFIVTATNTADSMTIKIDDSDAIQLFGITSAKQIFRTAVLTIRYSADDNTFKIASQISPNFGHNVSDIFKPIPDMTSILSVGEYSLDGTVINDKYHPIPCEIAGASSNYVPQEIKDSDDYYRGFFGYTIEDDGSTSVSLPILGGESLRWLDTVGDVDADRELGSWQKASVIAGNDDDDGANTSLQNMNVYRESFGLENADLTGLPLDANIVNWASGNGYSLNYNPNLSKWLAAVRSRNIAYPAKTRL